MAPLHEPAVIAPQYAPKNPRPQPEGSLGGSDRVLDAFRANMNTVRQRYQSDGNVFAAPRSEHGAQLGEVS